MTSTASRRATASPLAVWVGLATLYFVWGSTYIGIKLAVDSIPPFLMASSRFLIAGLFLLAWCVVRNGPAVLRVSRVELRDSFIVGALLLGGGMGMVAVGEQTVPSGVSALLIALLPVWVAVLGRVAFGERLPRIVLVGIAVGVVGVGILVAPAGSSSLAFNAGGLAALFLSPISWASGSLYSSHRARLPRLPLLATAIQMLCGAAALAIMAVAAGELRGFSPAAVTVSSWLGFTYLVTVGSCIGYTTYVWLLRVAPLPKIATYAYVNPIVAFVLSAILLGEELSPRTVVAAFVIVAAVALIITARSRTGAGHALDPIEAVEAGEPAIEVVVEPAAGLTLEPGLGSGYEAGLDPEVTSRPGRFGKPAEREASR
jgi:drug/metabolite transporter (DMT)-like permease